MMRTPLVDFFRILLIKVLRTPVILTLRSYFLISGKPDASWTSTSC
jgi:hypothetical protein